MYILAEELGINNYEPVSMLTVWDHNPKDSYDSCDYYLEIFVQLLKKKLWW